MSDDFSIDVTIDNSTLNTLGSLCNTAESECRYCRGTGRVRLMQSMAQINGPSVRGADAYRPCPKCLGTGRQRV